MKETKYEMWTDPAATGVDHDHLHWLPRAHLLLVPHLPRREGREQNVQEFRRRPLVGTGERMSQIEIGPYRGTYFASLLVVLIYTTVPRVLMHCNRFWCICPHPDNPVHRWLRRRRPGHVEGQGHSLLLRPARHFILRSSSREFEFENCWLTCVNFHDILKTTTSQKWRPKLRPKV